MVLHYKNLPFKLTPCGPDGKVLVSLFVFLGRGPEHMTQPKLWNKGVFCGDV